MSYKILSTRTLDETLFTTVKYTLQDETEITVEVSHFAPKTKQDIIDGIENREVSEQNKYNASKIAESLKLDLESEL